MHYPVSDKLHPKESLCKYINDQPQTEAEFSCNRHLQKQRRGIYTRALQTSTLVKLAKWCLKPNMLFILQIQNAKDMEQFLLSPWLIPFLKHRIEALWVILPTCAFGQAVHWGQFWSAALVKHGGFTAVSSECTVLCVLMCPTSPQSFQTSQLAASVHSTLAVPMHILKRFLLFG